MGLDMYLNVNAFIPASSYGESTSDPGPKYRKVTIEGIDMPIPTGGWNPVNYVSEVNIRVGYWRKANHIHQWFVGNVQGGKDECQEADVSIEQLKELDALCEKVLLSKSAEYAAEHLPPQEGFFFGSTDIPEYHEDPDVFDYWADTRETKDIIANAITVCESLAEQKLWASIRYRSSW